MPGGGTPSRLTGEPGHDDGEPGRHDGGTLTGPPKIVHHDGDERGRRNGAVLQDLHELPGNDVGDSTAGTMA